MSVNDGGEANEFHASRTGEADAGAAKSVQAIRITITMRNKGPQHVTGASATVINEDLEDDQGSVQFGPIAPGQAVTRTTDLKGAADFVHFSAALDDGKTSFGHGEKKNMTSMVLTVPA